MHQHLVPGCCSTGSFPPFPLPSASRQLPLPAPAPPLPQAHYRDYDKMKFARCVFVIHNMAHQGRAPFADTSLLELNEHYRDMFMLDDPIGGEHMNIMKAGLQTAHRVVAVSHGYAWECKTQVGGAGRHARCPGPAAGAAADPAGRAAAAAAFCCCGSSPPGSPPPNALTPCLPASPAGGRLGPAHRAAGGRLEAARHRQRH